MVLPPLRDVAACLDTYGYRVKELVIVHQDM